ncbi:Hypothetical protein PP7435_CHR3-0199 [Komagataella phaffii CBS 7435]|uniref:Uncharacterized protein n=2 Tax=Komagataella phaffii TaxID=460519 RepID=C4R648_KOMPG|nr:Hypothetical protein PAS_chr3_0970 [Komagataella phaffii GS115]AOA63632.1 GQ67_04101T0 [Komagataella phaffii]CAH2449144.1 Hypothetical protein BQ9382_C3-1110 [Komagataella phaffii CBS 7435]AOA68796.1 GQ68_04074T0 [Komagataella phaffii GS115]CAY71034.1 Hypothetical protein PAS_chr3_0970 [Komagataella phaffii GS115]CCA39171.1 Hypothetical protein PP7435_CHR3-0199 [Komagataella phaffii CBS 7435]
MDLRDKVDTAAVRSLRLDIKDSRNSSKLATPVGYSPVSTNSEVDELDSLNKDTQYQIATMQYLNEISPRGSDIIVSPLSLGSSVNNYFERQHHRKKSEPTACSADHADEHKKMNHIIQWYCCSCGKSFGDLTVAHELKDNRTELLNHFQSVSIRYDCDRCKHMMCPYCLKGRLKDLV